MFIIKTFVKLQVVTYVHEVDPQGNRPSKVLFLTNSDNQLNQMILLIQPTRGDETYKEVIANIKKA